MSAPTGSVSFDQAAYKPGETITATVSYSDPDALTGTAPFNLADSQGNVIKLVGTFTTAPVTVTPNADSFLPWPEIPDSNDGASVQFTATAATGPVTLRPKFDLTDSQGNVTTIAGEYRLEGAPAPDPTPPRPMLILGSSIGGNGDPTDLESRVGTLGCHRTYYSAWQVAGAVSWIARDLAAGRVPWVTFKFPQSWVNMAGGLGDAWARSTLYAIAQALNGSLGYIDFHHEPEGDEDGGGYQGLGGWAQTQARIYAMPRPANLRQAIIFTPWNWVATNVQKNPWDMSQLFPGDLPCDVFGCDAYNYYGAYKTKAEFIAQSGTLETKSVEIKERTQFFADFAKASGNAWGIGEWSGTHAISVKDPDWFERQVRDMIAMGCEISSLFCSTLNSRGDWDIRGDTGREAAFKRSLILAAGG